MLITEEKKTETDADTQQCLLDWILDIGRSGHFF